MKIICNVFERTFVCHLIVWLFVGSDLNHIIFLCNSCLNVISHIVDRFSQCFFFCEDIAACHVVGGDVVH